MKRILLAVLALMFCSTLALADDSREMLTIKRDLAIERVMRIKTEIELMRLQFKASQDNLKLATKDFEDVSAALNKLDADQAKPKQ